MCSVQGLWGEGWPGIDRHRASSERATTMANPESREHFGVALALEFPHPCSGYFRLSNYKHSLLVPPMLEVGGISLHFKPLNPRPHREAIFPSSKDTCWRYLQAGGRRISPGRQGSNTVNADSTSIQNFMCGVEKFTLKQIVREEADPASSVAFLFALLDLLEKGLLVKLFMHHHFTGAFFLMNFSFWWTSASISTRHYVKAESLIHLLSTGEQCYFQLPTMSEASAQRQSYPTGKAAKGHAKTQGCLRQHCLLRLKQLHQVYGMYAAGILPREG